ncbi:MAG: glycosyltransferase family 4 protein [candidate division KSB1 bacterium]|nr:glycosyltransferase family 4 protein [candidate division KSB1 bacterium]MDZ7276102.1 glycosyltransferase family 4 protein [candidate division KSB1 bacterium]MDZ7287118.1 glycosyltransferase family 4 protein [candidate division KSB1 bacterium]MDZ7296957.1 glycosyltransferase family 4 protein [candidate division KSB1 bacterium]MDZ7307151.1 glycosyltransferase family 4 protein [candidate division KSB1 bacterium]
MMPQAAHICFLQDSLYSPTSTGWTGTHLQNYNLARQFYQAGMKVSFVVASALPGATVPPGYQGMTVRFVKTSAIAPFLFFWREVKQALRQLAPDFIYVRGRSWLVAVAQAYAAEQGAEFIWASNGEDGCDPWKFTSKAKRAKVQPFRRLYRMTKGALEDLAYARGIRQASFLVNQTKDQQKALAKHFQREGNVIYSMQEVPPGPFQKADPLLVLWIGRLSREKRPELFFKLVDAFKTSNVAFRMIGPISKTDQWAAEICRLAQVCNFRHLNWLDRDALLELMGTASLLINTSSRCGDGIPNSMIEAWLREVPVLSYELDPDDLINREGMGLVAGANWQEFVQSFAKLLDNREQIETLSHHVRSRAIDLFAPERVISRYQRLLGKKPVEPGILRSVDRNSPRLAPVEPANSHNAV